MSNFLTFSEVDTAIQNKMANKAPGETKRLEAINDALRDLYSEYDIEAGVRKINQYIVMNGGKVDLTSSLMTDFKRMKYVRPIGEDTGFQEFAKVDDDVLNIHLANDQRINEYSVSYDDGKQYGRFNSRNEQVYKTLHEMNDLTDNGTWAADTTNSDALGLTTGDVVVVDNSDNIQFNVDVSQSANNYALIECTDMDDVDLDDFENLGKARFRVYIPSITNFTSVELRWGNDSSNYWSNTATTQVDGSSFVAGWNEVEIDWNGATETGTVTESEIDYLAVKMNYTASYTDQNKFRVERIRMYLPELVELAYYTYYLSQDSSGTFQDEMTATSTDTLLLPKRFKRLIVNMAMRPLFYESEGEAAAQTIARISSFIKSEKTRLGLDDVASSPLRETKKIKIRKMW